MSGYDIAVADGSEPLTDASHPPPIPSGRPPGFVRRAAAASWGVLEGLRARLSMREDSLFLLLAVIIGLLSGLAVVCFRVAIDLSRRTLLGSGPAPGPLRVILVPMLMGLVLAVLA